jgi:ABC-type uncharacterized transport system permease subunit
MPVPFLPIALIAYIVGVFLASLSLAYRFTAPRVAAAAVFAVAWVAHLGAVANRGMTTGRFPLTNGAEYLLFLGFAVMTLHLLVWFVWRVYVAGVVLPPLAALATFGALALLPAGTSPPIDSPRGWFLFHTTVSTLGMATLIVALAMSLIYLIQDRALKSRRTLRLLEKLPPLDRCDHVGFQALVLGFVLLTVGIATGVIVNESVHERIWVPGIKQYLALSAWIIFASVLVARFKLGFRGRKSAYLTITGVTLGLMTVIGMTL